MSKAQSAEHLGDDLDATARLQRAGCFEDCVEAAPIDILHGEKRHAVIFAKVENGDDIGVKAPPGGSRLAPEALQPLFRAATRRQFGADDLDRYRTVDDGIIGAIDLAHCAGAEQPVDTISADALNRLHVRFLRATRRTSIISPACREKLADGRKND